MEPMAVMDGVQASRMIDDQLLDLALMLNPGHDLDRRRHLAMLAARLGYVAVHIPVPDGQHPSSAEVDALVQAAAPAMVVVDDAAETEGVVRRNDPALVRQARALVDAQEDARPVIVAVPIAIGRTLNEAVARADRDPRFTGERHPRECGIFGTFEQAQQQVLDLAKAGAEVLLVDITDDVDAADVLAQVRALVVGPTPALFDR